MRTMYQHPGPFDESRAEREAGGGGGFRTETVPLPFLGKRPDISVVGWAYGEGLLGRGPAA